MINNKILGLIGLATRARKIVFGTDACIDNIANKNIKLIIIASDASERTKTKFKRITTECNVPYFEMSSIYELSNAMGKSNKAVIGITDVGFSNKIIKIINGGE